MSAHPFKTLPGPASKLLEKSLPASSLALGRVRRHRTIFISDTHLGTRGCKADRLADFLAQLPDRPLPAEERVVVALALAVTVSAGEAAGRRQDFTGPRDVGGDHPVAAPEGLGLVQMRDDPHASQQVVQERRLRPSDQASRGSVGEPSWPPPGESERPWVSST